MADDDEVIESSAGIVDQLNVARERGLLKEANRVTVAIRNGKGGRSLHLLLHMPDGSMSFAPLDDRVVYQRLIDMLVKFGDVVWPKATH